MPSPTAENPAWLATGDEKSRAVRRMFDEIAPTYDRLNGIMSLSLHHRWRKLAVATLRLTEGDSALDVCCGTGDFLAPLRGAVGRSGHVTGIDFSPAMLALAPTKDPEATLAVGDACALPAPTGTYHAVTIGWGIRNVPDIDMAHREAFRVLRPGGRIVSLDCASPRNVIVRQVARFVGKFVLPAIGRLFGKQAAYTYLPESVERFWDRERLKRSMEAAGFVEVSHQDLFFGNICLHVGRKP